MSDPLNNRPLTLLGFDYGSRRIGVAVGQTLTATANPLASVRVKGFAPDWKAIERLIRIWEPDLLVVGLPLNMDGTEQEITRAARNFLGQLEKRFRIPSYMADERLSTREAKQRLASLGTPQADADPVAAQVIIETWFSSQPEASFIPPLTSNWDLPRTSKENC